jgi:predicted unusual protein kinase regulating ubiquinone biosynthesis (AarF/ABC1/UbiB family)
MFYGIDTRVSGYLPEIHPVPIGSGCCAQVYIGMLDITHLSLQSRKRIEARFRESLSSGKVSGFQIPVAIKVLHPDVAKSFARDLVPML